MPVEKKKTTVIFLCFVLQRTILSNTAHPQGCLGFYLCNTKSCSKLSKKPKTSIPANFLRMLLHSIPEYWCNCKHKSKLKFNWFFFYLLLFIAEHHGTLGSIVPYRARVSGLLQSWGYWLCSVSVHVPFMPLSHKNMPVDLFLDVNVYMQLTCN